MRPAPPAPARAWPSLPALSLRARFILACSLLVATTVTATLWTLAALTDLAAVVGHTVEDSDETTAATSRLASALEREDDALLLALAGDELARGALDVERRQVDAALADLSRLLVTDAERERSRRLREEVDAYRAAADRIAAAASERDALARYHQEANPLLRHAVGSTAMIRDRHFEAMREVVALAGREAERARGIVLGITAVALLIAVLVALHLTGAIINPIRRLTRGANAISQGRFEERIDLPAGDELGELASAFNQMAERLDAFRRANLDEVLRAKAALEATLQALPDAVMLVAADGRLVSMNATAASVCAAAGLSRAATIDDLAPLGLETARLREAIRAGQSGPRSTDLTTAIRVEHEGRLRRLLPRLVPLAEVEPARDGAVLLLYDVTELARLDEMRAELVAVAAHELRTPVTTLRMTLLMLQESAATLPPAAREIVATALVGADQLAETVDEFLDLARIEAGQMRLTRESVDPAALVADVLRRAAPRAGPAGVRLAADVEEDLPAFVGDPFRLRLVLDNLVSNALKYSAAGGLVTIAAARAPGTGAGLDAIRLAVSDTGPGIPPEFQPRVFDKFFRVEHHLPRSEDGVRGSGIGLYLCRQVVELHGGTIACTPGPDGRGTRVTLDLPLVPQTVGVEAL